jgi:hypothetical protein
MLSQDQTLALDDRTRSRNALLLYERMNSEYLVGKTKGVVSLWSVSLGVSPSEGIRFEKLFSSVLSILTYVWTADGRKDK